MKQLPHKNTQSKSIVRLWIEKEKQASLPDLLKPTPLPVKRQLNPKSILDTNVLGMLL
ncbi:hypothetical protein [Vibrio splendidus]|uniref:hypothetical protein n=1 Tax=Vibrio splendidus TaxID=29497 RepID=UPI001300113E|nr:hypothetical protein [Vibrio splendidus]